MYFRCESVLSSSFNLSHLTRSHRNQNVLGYPLGEKIVDENKVKVLTWSPVGLSAVLKLVGPSELGGLGDSLERNALALAKSKNISILEAKLEVSFKFKYI